MCSNSEFTELEQFLKKHISYLCCQLNHSLNLKKYEFFKIVTTNIPGHNENDVPL